MKLDTLDPLTQHAPYTTNLSSWNKGIIQHYKPTAKTMLHNVACVSVVLQL